MNKLPKHFDLSVSKAKTATKLQQRTQLVWYYTKKKEEKKKAKECKYIIEV